MPYIDTNELEVREPRSGWKGRFFHSANMTFGYWNVSAGSWIHEHSHPNEEVWNIIGGVSTTDPIALDGRGDIKARSAHCEAVEDGSPRHRLAAGDAGRRRAGRSSGVYLAPR